MKNHFLYTVLNTAAPLERMAEKNSSNGGQEKKIRGLRGPLWSEFPNFVQTL